MKVATCFAVNACYCELYTLEVVGVKPLHVHNSTRLPAGKVLQIFNCNSQVPQVLDSNNCKNFYCSSSQSKAMKHTQSANADQLGDRHVMLSE